MFALKHWVPPVEVAFIHDCWESPSQQVSDETHRRAQGAILTEEGCRTFGFRASCTKGWVAASPTLPRQTTHRNLPTSEQASLAVTQPLEMKLSTKFSSFTLVKSLTRSETSPLKWALLKSKVIPVQVSRLDHEALFQSYQLP